MMLTSVVLITLNETKHHSFPASILLLSMESRLIYYALHRIHLYRLHLARFHCSCCKRCTFSFRVEVQWDKRNENEKEKESESKITFDATSFLFSFTIVDAVIINLVIIFVVKLNKDENEICWIKWEIKKLFSTSYCYARFSSTNKFTM